MGMAGSEDLPAEPAEAVDAPGTHRRVPNVFISYSHRDLYHAHTLDQHLAGIRRAHGGVIFFDRDWIKAGSVWKREIDQGLEQSDVFILLLSKSFIDSDFCIGTEARRAMERRSQEPGRVKVICVLLRDCDYADIRPDPASLRLGDLQIVGALQKGELVPLTRTRDRDSSWKRVIDAVKNHYDLGAPSDESTAPIPTPRPGIVELTPDLDWGDVAARCDRDPVIEALYDLAAAKGGVLALNGPVSQVPTGALLSRCALDLHHDLGLRTHVVHLRQFGAPDGVERFERSICVNANLMNGNREISSMESLFNWLLEAGYKALVVGHYVQPDSLGEAQLRQRLRLAAEAQQRLNNPDCPLVVVQILRHRVAEAAEGRIPGLTSLRRSGRATRRLVERAFASEFPDSQDLDSSSRRIVELGDFEDEHLRLWREHPEVRKSIAARTVQVNQAIAMMVESRSMTLQALQDHLEHIFGPPAAAPGKSAA